MNIGEMQKALGMEKVPACFDKFYEEIKDTYQMRVKEMLSKTFLTNTLDSCNALKHCRVAVLEAANQILQNEAMCLLVCLLEKWVLENEVLEVVAYTPPVGEGAAYDFLHIFPAIARIPDILEDFRARKVPQEVIDATMTEYDYCVGVCEKAYNRPAFNFGRLNWINRLLHKKLIRISRFKYDLPGKFFAGVRIYQNKQGDFCVLASNVEVHESGRLLGSVGHTDATNSYVAVVTETEDAISGHAVKDGIIQKEITSLPKEEWKLCISEEDKAIRIHIPSEGSFEKDSIQAAYNDAREVMEQCYPDMEYKAFFCSSWLMSEELKQILKPTSNIVGFQNDFTKVPFKSTGTLVFSFVFNMAGIPQDLSALPENTSLERGVKKLYQDGGYLHEGAGFFLK